MERYFIQEFEVTKHELAMFNSFTPAQQANYIGNMRENKMDSAKTAKLLASLTIHEAMINGFACTKEQYEQWLTAPIDKQIELEMEWGFLWRESYTYSTKPNGLEPLVADSVAATLAQRGSRYGDFTDHARICQDLKKVMMTELTWFDLSNVQRQALEVIQDKVARILSGDPNYDDNWHDIQGYAKLVEDRLPKGNN